MLTQIPRDLLYIIIDYVGFASPVGYRSLLLTCRFFRDLMRTKPGLHHRISIIYNRDYHMSGLGRPHGPDTYMVPTIKDLTTPGFFLEYYGDGGFARHKTEPPRIHESQQKQVFNIWFVDCIRSANVRNLEMLVYYICQHATKKTEYSVGSRYIILYYFGAPQCECVAQSHPQCECVAQSHPQSECVAQRHPQSECVAQRHPQQGMDAFIPNIADLSDDEIRHIICDSNLLWKIHPHYLIAQLAMSGRAHIFLSNYYGQNGFRHLVHQSLKAYGFGIFLMPPDKLLSFLRIDAALNSLAFEFPGDFKTLMEGWTPDGILGQNIPVSYTGEKSIYPVKGEVNFHTRTDLTPGLVAEFKKKFPGITIAFRSIRLWQNPGYDLDAIIQHSGDVDINMNCLCIRGDLPVIPYAFFALGCCHRTPITKSELAKMASVTAIDEYIFLNPRLTPGDYLLLRKMIYDFVKFKPVSGTSDANKPDSFRATINFRHVNCEEAHFIKYCDDIYSHNPGLRWRDIVFTPGITWLPSAFHNMNLPGQQRLKIAKKYIVNIRSGLTD